MNDFDEMVRAEAYLIWHSEGCPDGQHERHWWLANERVRSQLVVKAQAPIIPLSLKRVVLSTRLKRKPREESRLRASA